MVISYDYLRTYWYSTKFKLKYVEAAGWWVAAVEAAGYAYGG